MSLDWTKVEAAARILGEVTPHLARLIHRALEGDADSIRRLAEILPNESPDTVQRKLERELAAAKFGDRQ